jgi:hypothetical protein
MSGSLSRSCNIVDLLVLANCLKTDTPQDNRLKTDKFSESEGTFFGPDVTSSGHDDDGHCGNGKDDRDSHSLISRGVRRLGIGASARRRLIRKRRSNNPQKRLGSLDLRQSGNFQFHDVCRKRSVSE